MNIESRREFPGGVISAGVGAMLPAGALFGQASGAWQTNLRIDVHHHYRPPFMENLSRPWSADPSQVAVFAELDRRKTTVFLHPNTTPFCCMNPPGVSNFVAEYDNDAERLFPRYRV